MFGSEIFRTMIRPYLVFVGLMVGVSALLQDSLIIYKQAGAYTHWAVVLLILPIMIGVILRLLDTAYPLALIIVAAATSTVSLYFLYKMYFWAQAPTILNALFLFAVIAGGAHLPYSRGPIERMFGILISPFKSQKKNKTTNRTAKNPKQAPVQRAAPAYGNTIPMIEMTIGLASLGLSIYSVVFMGNA